MTDWLALGTVGRAKGTHGAFMFRPYNPQSDAFDTVERVQLDGTVYEVEAVRELPNGIELKLAGIDSPEDAKRFVNKEICAAREELPEAADDEILLADLAGKRAVEDGRDIGRITGFSRAGNEIFFDVQGNNGETVSVPSSGPFVVRIEGDAVVLQGVAALFEE